MVSNYEIAFNSVVVIKCEIHFRFRDKFNADLTEKNYFDRNVFASFSSDFEKILKAVENATVKEKQAGQKMKTFEESAKSQKTIASLIENPTANSSKANSGSKPSNANDQFDFKENIEPVRVFQGGRIAWPNIISSTAT